LGILRTGGRGFRKLVEAVRRRQVLVTVAEVVLAELARCIPERFEELGDRRVFVLEADLRARQSDLAQAGPVGALPSDERRTPGVAALFAIESIPSSARRSMFGVR
jgi:hypothetical protein